MDMNFDKKPPNCVIKILFAYLQTVNVKKQWVLQRVTVDKNDQCYKILSQGIKYFNSKIILEIFLLNDNNCDKDCHQKWIA